MINKRIGYSSIAKGLFVGIVVGTAAALLYVSRSKTRFRIDIPLESGRIQRRNQSLSETRVETNIETEKPAKRSIGWLVAFYFASAVAMISDWRLKKK
jgi:hypothetical protein